MRIKARIQTSLLGQIGYCFSNFIFCCFEALTNIVFSKLAHGILHCCQTTMPHLSNKLELLSNISGVLNNIFARRNNSFAMITVVDCGMLGNLGVCVLTQLKGLYL